MSKKQVATSIQEGDDVPRPLPLLNYVVQSKNVSRRDTDAVFEPPPSRARACITR